MRALMRQDPDIIMIGEIRDLETAEMAVQAALTGHLVFSTLHTNDAPSALHAADGAGRAALPAVAPRILGVLAQRLVRTLCPHVPAAGRARSAPRCWPRSSSPGRSTGRRLPPVQAGGLRRLPHDGLPRPHGHLRAADRQRGLSSARVRADVDLAALRQQAVADGMRPLRLAGALRAAEGLTTLEEVIAATPPLDPGLTPERWSFRPAAPADWRQQLDCVHHGHRPVTGRSFARVNP
ncbi:MAG: ATPase, T2SS/T4P/T4SS family [Ottowia sp.]